MFGRHQVVKRWLNEGAMTSIIAAGTGTQGSALNELNNPMGIFVDLNSDLYVADNKNNRIQLFKSGQSIAITVAGDGSSQETISLLHPTGVVLDRDGYLFIVDSGNNRIVGSGLDGFRCLVGCDAEGSESTQLLDPFTLNFDQFGNLFVTDVGDRRIQKYSFYENSYVPYQLTMNSQIYSRDCNEEMYYYEVIQMKVFMSGNYIIRSNGTRDTYVSIYKNNFNPLNSSENLLRENDENPINIQLNYPIKLTSQSPTFDRDSQRADFYYEVFQFNIITNGSYVLWSESQMGTFGYIYKDNFDPNQPLKNKLFEHSGMCNEGQFKLIVDLQVDVKYILVVTTFYPNVTGNLSIIVSGPKNPQVLRQRQLLRPHQHSPAQWHRSIFIG
ncbi:unnamed protein product [Adineta steineri]|uniref:NHL repeat containing protein-like protein n=2 Tax=Adineta steineri TaxID=433720 RepID=A0A816ECW4_9BILA|nr:unnamed protein product [Adineta steineri]CAF1648276.1 unnamed protein product [Adineta steineri]